MWNSLLKESQSSLDKENVIMSSIHCVDSDVLIYDTKLSDMKRGSEMSKNFLMTDRNNHNFCKI